MLVSDYLDRWLASIAGNVRPNTALSYSSTARLYVKPHIGHIPVALLSTAQIRDLFTKLAAEGRSARIRELVYYVLKMSLRAALEEGFIVVSPMTSTIKSPRVEKVPVKAMSPEDIRTFLKAAEGDELEALWNLAIATGMRQGELLGLNWDDIDLDKGRVLVCATLIEQNGRIIGRASPKSSAGTRNIKIPARVLGMLKALRARNVDPVIVFAQEPGRYFLKTTIMRRFKKLLGVAKLPDMKFHALRHSTVSNLISKGASLKVVQTMIGHSSAGFTLSTYAHLLEGDSNVAAKAMEEVMG